MSDPVDNGHIPVQKRVHAVMEKIKMSPCSKSPGPFEGFLVDIPQKLQELSPISHSHGQEHGDIYIYIFVYTYIHTYIHTYIIHDGIDLILNR